MDTTQRSKVHRPPSYSDTVLAALRARRDAVAFIDGERRLSYGEIEGQVTRIAGGLVAAGVRRGDGVGLISGNRAEVFSAFLATLAIGARYTPLSLYASTEDHAYLQRHAELRLVLFDPDSATQAVQGLAKLAPDVELASLGPSTLGADVLAADAIELVPGEGPEQSDVALIAYTGGTTGRPKGVVLPHRSLSTSLAEQLAHCQVPDDVRFLGATPFSHALCLLVAPALLRGGTFVLQPGFEPSAFLAATEGHGITTTFLVPTMIYALLDHPALATTDVSSLRTVFYGAAPINQVRLRQALEAFGPVFVQCYGQTEAPLMISVLRKEDHRLDQPQWLASAGRPLPGSTVAVLDSEGRRCAQGEAGEVCVRGPLVMDGYWKAPELTEEALRDDWLHTGDIGRLDADGFLTLIDRTKDVIISGGLNIYPSEVENVLNQHPAVRAAAVVGVPDDYWGEAVTAVVQLDPGAQVDVVELQDLVRAHKGSVHTPKSVIFVEALPMTLLGKIDKKVVKASLSAARADSGTSPGASG